MAFSFKPSQKSPSFHWSSSSVLSGSRIMRETERVRMIKEAEGPGAPDHHLNPGEASQNPELCLCLPSQSRLILITRPWALIGVTEKHGVAACIYIKVASPQKGTPTSSWAVKIMMSQWLVTFSKTTNINSYILDLRYEYFGVSKNFLNRAPVAQGSAPRMNGWNYMKLKGLGTPK